MNKRTIAAMAGAIALLGQAQANTMTFSGVITEVDILGDFWTVEAKVGDSFSGTVFFNSDMSRLVARVNVVDAHWNVEYPVVHGNNQNVYDFSLSSEGRDFKFDTTSVPLGWGSGTDDGVYLFGSNFFAYVADHPVDEPQSYVHVSGIVTKQTVTTPDTGDTAAMLGLSFILTAIFSHRIIRLR